MQKKPLGNTGIEVSPLAFGGNVFGWTVDENTSHTLLDGFTDAGFNFIDTADMYSRWKPGNHGGESETIIGTWLKKSGKRDKVVIATKVGMDMGEGKKGLSKSYIFKAVEDSLKRLQTDFIDLYQSHTDDSETARREHWVPMTRSSLRARYVSSGRRTMARLVSPARSPSAAR